MPDGADLQDHDTHGVRDDVVEFPSDSGPLLGDRDTRGGLALPFGLCCALLCRLGLCDALTQGEAGQPGDGEQDRVKTKSPAEWFGLL